MGGGRGQSQRISMAETACGTAIGYAVAVATQIVVLPWFGFRPEFGDNLRIAAVFTAVSLVRGYVVRRVFNWVGGRGK